MATTHPAHVAIAFNERINSRDLAGLEELMAEEHVFRGAMGRRVNGRADSVAVWLQFFSAVPNYFSTIDKVLTLDDGVVIATGHTLSSQDELAGPTLWVVRVHDGSVREWNMMSDTPENRRHFDLAR